MSQERLPTYSEIHQEHREWLNALNFYHNELKYFQTRLAKIASKNDDEEVHQQIVDFKAAFFDMLYKIDEMRYTIYQHEKEVADHYELAQRTKVNINEDHHAKKQEFEQFEKEYHTLKLNFNQFLAKMR